MSFNMSVATPARLNTPMLIDALRKGAASNKAFNAVCHMFATRERARQQVTIESLMMRMAQEGFRFSKKEYQGCLTFLASCGIGTLDVKTDTKEVKALKNIKVTLQSVGKAALAQGSSLEKFSPQYEYQEVKFKDTIVQPPATAAPVIPPPAASGHVVMLVTRLNGKEVKLPLPRELTTQELGELVIMLSSNREV